tara:strand:+ start:4026 stop:4181 length:156 start_codon:yes stop_codon:yes gene_type:complete
MQAIAEGVSMGAKIGLALAVVNVLTRQFFGTGFINYAAESVTGQDATGGVY